MIVTGLYATAVVLGAANLAQAERDHEPDRAVPAPLCHVPLILTLVAWRVARLYPRAASGFRPAKN